MPKIKSAIFPAQAAVVIFVNGVIFGAKDHGFTINGPNDTALFVNRTGNARVAGNTAIGRISQLSSGD